MKGAEGDLLLLEQVIAVVVDDKERVIFANALSLKHIAPMIVNIIAVLMSMLNMNSRVLKYHSGLLVNLDVRLRFLSSDDFLSFLPLRLESHEVLLVYVRSILECILCGERRSSSYYDYELSIY